MSFDLDFDYIDREGQPVWYTDAEIGEMEAEREEQEFQMEEAINEMLEQENADREAAEVNREDDGWVPSVIAEGLKWMDENVDEMRLMFAEREGVFA
jgi:hypothetical protein